jgi:hypothetical protein
MNIRIFLTIISLLQVHLTIGQDISLDDLVYFQTVKKSVAIDSVLLTKDKWDCNCLRKFDRIDLIKEWLYDIPDSTKENTEKDYVKYDEVGHGFASIITFYTADRRKADVILNQMTARKMPEEKIKTFGTGQVTAKISFFVGDKVAIQTVIGEDSANKTGKYVFIVMDKADYLKDFEIK